MKKKRIQIVWSSFNYDAMKQKYIFVHIIKLPRYSAVSIIRNVVGKMVVAIALKYSPKELLLLQATWSDCQILLD